MRSTADAAFTSPVQPNPNAHTPTLPRPGDGAKPRVRLGAAPGRAGERLTRGRGSADTIGLKSTLSAVSEGEPAGVDRLHAAHLDDAIRGQVGVRVQLDEGIGAIGEPVDLARRRE